MAISLARHLRYATPCAAAFRPLPTALARRFADRRWADTDDAGTAGLRGGTMPIGETRAMIAGMTPTLVEGIYVFCTTPDPSLAARCMQDAIGMFREREGMSFLLPLGRAEALGFSGALPMRQITLNVYSALDGVGLTAAVATALADRGIACNMVAAHHHDHVFLPADQATTAMDVLEALSRRAASS